MISSTEIHHTPRGWLEVGVCPSERTMDQHSVTELNYIHQKEPKTTSLSFEAQYLGSAMTVKMCAPKMLFSERSPPRLYRSPVLRTRGTPRAWIQSFVFPEKIDGLTWDVTQIKCYLTGINLCQSVTFSSWELDPGKRTISSQPCVLSLACWYTRTAGLVLWFCRKNSSTNVHHIHIELLQLQKVIWERNVKKNTCLCLAVFPALTQASYFWPSSFATQTSSSYCVAFIFRLFRLYFTCGNIDLQ